MGIMSQEKDLIIKFLEKYKNDWKNYGNNFYNTVITEFLQTKIIEYVSSQHYKNNMILIWWTSIRLLRDGIRKSFDLDYDTENLNKDSFLEICYDIKNFLEESWHDVSLDIDEESIKNEDFYNQKVAKCSFIIDSNFDFDWNWEQIYLSEVNLTISMDIKNGIWDYKKEDIIPTKTIYNIPVRTACIDSLLSKKISWFLWRVHKESIAKDITDIVFLLQETEPDYNMLYEYDYIQNSEQLKERLFSKLDKYSFNDKKIASKKLNILLLDKKYNNLLFDAKEIISDLLNYYK